MDPVTNSALSTPLREVFDSMTSVNVLRGLPEVKWTRTEWNVMTTYAEMLSDKAKELKARLA